MAEDNPRPAGPRVWYVPADVLMPARGSGTPGPAPEIKVIEHSAYAKLFLEARALVSEVAKAENIVVEDTCEECGTFKSVRYSVKSATEALTRFREFLKQNGLGEK